MNPKDAVAFVKQHGVVLQAARGPVPSLAEAIAGGPIRGSWWAHPQAKTIFRAAQAVCDSPEILVCKLIDGKVTYVHRRLWPALVKLAPSLNKAHLAKVWDEHTETGAHVAKQLAFPRWVPTEVAAEAEALTAQEAANLLPSGLIIGKPAPRERKRRPRASR
jgi:hypothetical protein